MYRVFSVLIFAILSFLLYLPSTVCDNGSNWWKAWVVAAVIGVIIAIILFVEMLYANMYASEKQRKKIEELRLDLDRMRMRKNELLDFLPLMRRALMEKYPELEERIFSALSKCAAGTEGGQISLKAADFPELQSSGALRDMVAKAESQYSTCYNWQHEIAKDVYELRARLVDPWLFTSWTPEIPEDLQNVEKELERVGEVS